MINHVITKNSFCEVTKTFELLNFDHKILDLFILESTRMFVANSKKLLQAFPEILNSQESHGQPDNIVPPALAAACTEA